MPPLSRWLGPSNRLFATCRVVFICVAVIVGGGSKGNVRFPYTRAFFAAGSMVCNCDPLRVLHSMWVSWMFHG